MILEMKIEFPSQPRGGGMIINTNCNFTTKPKGQEKPKGNNSKID